MDLQIGSVLLFCFATVGMSHIIVDGSILKEFRDLMEKILPAKLNEIFKCYQCCSLYTGLFCGYFILVRPCLEPHQWLLTIIWTFLCGCASSFLSPWAALYLNVLETKMIIDCKEKEEK
jgi:hypothetical protein